MGTNATRYLAIDWGSTNRRLLVLNDAGQIVDFSADSVGVTSVGEDGFSGEWSSLRRRYGDLPAFAAGMIGSSHGWIHTEYVDLPAGLDTIATRLVYVPGHDFAIVPGLSYRSDRRFDVMRGEEVQVLGAIAAGMAPKDAVFCQPGTHNKWVEVEAGRIVSFRTAMTGEIFALLRSHSLLANALGAAAIDSAAFAEGVERATRNDLLTALFEVRAAQILDNRSSIETTSLASGLLIGADVASHPSYDEKPVHVLADSPLADLYAAAIRQRGGVAVLIDARPAFAAGIHHIRRLSI